MSTLPQKNKLTPLWESAGLFFSLMVIFKTLHLLGGAAGWILEVLVPITWVYLPVILLYWKKRDFKQYGLIGNGWRRDLILALVIGLVVLPLFLTGFYLYHGLFLDRTIEIRWNLQIAWAALIQVLVIAFPEEVFFRGYMQSHLNILFTKRLNWRGWSLSWSIVVTSLLFALGHFIIHPNPARLAVFFPSLLFGLMRERSGSVISSGLFHGLANVTVLIFRF